MRSELEAYLKASSNQRLLRRAGLGAGSSLLLLLAAVLVFGSAAGRALHFWKSYEQPNPYELYCAARATIPWNRAHAWNRGWFSTGSATGG
ncbi:MAG: hypothetical protein U5K31_02845 [Balneolaceae bacterium]|nr:hypothetical protein [Balneolaceae bacterium]